MRRLLPVLLLIGVSLFARELPKTTGAVSDRAGVLSENEIRQLERELQQLAGATMTIHLSSTRPEGAVLAAPGVENGIALFAFTKDGTMQLEVAPALESKISDAAAQAILDEQVAPAFRKKQYADALSGAIEQVQQLLDPGSVEYVTTALGRTRRIHKLLSRYVDVMVNPTYPEDARRHGASGLVKMEVLVEPSGRVRAVTVIQGVEMGVSEHVVAAVRQWRFKPRPEPILIDVVVNMRL